MIFKDYHRTIIGYHGTKLSIARDIVTRRKPFQASHNDDDWLGHGVYFWEYAPNQARWWAENRARRQKWDEPIAIVASMIRLSFCLDLLEPYNVLYLQALYNTYIEAHQHTQAGIPQNMNQHKRLDCGVFEYAYSAIQASGGSVDTARAVYVPTHNKRVWKRSWISLDAHIQVCVRNQNCILGTWLHYPEVTEE